MKIQLNSVHAKIITTVIVICSLLAIAIGGVLFVYESISYRQLVEKNLTATADVLGTNLVTPLLFSDPQVAKEILFAINTNADILHAVLYDNNAKEFARYTSDSSEVSPSLPSTKRFEQLFEYRGQSISILRTIEHRSQTIGYLYLVASKKQLMQRRTQHIQVVIVTLFASILIAILLSLGLLRSITKPIEQLTQSATLVVKGDLSQRVNVSTKDEIGQLANTFNGMLDSLQSSMVSKDYLETIIESMNDMLLVLSAEGRIQKINLAGQVVLGCKEQELLDKSIETIITDIDPTAIAKLLGKGNELIEPNDIKSIESGFITKSGVVVPVHLSVSVMKNEHNEIQGIVCVAQNLTEQKQAEFEIKQGYKSLTDANLELMETQSQLIQSAKLASVGEMATGIAHELNQPLGVIAMSADLQLSRLKKGKGDTVEQSLALIIKQVERATTIINHLRTFGRESNKIARGIVSIKQMIKDSFIMHNEQLRLLDIDVIKEIDDNLPVIHCNAIQIEQVLSNLINNAKDALASSTTKQITVRARQVDTKVVIEVEDTGTGITQCNIERIFDPFFTTKEVGKGTGLGLSISYGIIKDHDGLLSVSSILGKGSMFFIELPGIKQESI